MKRIKSIFRNEELPVVGGFLFQYLERDLKEFEGFSGKFNIDYLKLLNHSSKQSMQIINPETLTKELKFITDTLYASMIELRPLLNRVQAYAKLANGTMKINVEDFGVKEVRLEIRRKDAEALVNRLGILITNVLNNMDALVINGFKPELCKDLDILKGEIYHANILQEIKIKEREAHVIANFEVLEHLWEMIKEIADTGKALYQYENPEKYADYTLSKIRTKLRHEHKRKEKEAATATATA